MHKCIVWVVKLLLSHVHKPKAQLTLHEEYTKRPTEATDVYRITSDLVDALQDIHKKTQEEEKAQVRKRRKTELSLPNFEPRDFFSCFSNEDVPAQAQGKNRALRNCGNSF